MNHYRVSHERFFTVVGCFTAVSVCSLWRSCVLIKLLWITTWFAVSLGPKLCSFFVSECCEKSLSLHSQNLQLDLMVSTSIMTQTAESNTRFSCSRTNKTKVSASDAFKGPRNTELVSGIWFIYRHNFEMCHWSMKSLDGLRSSMADNSAIIIIIH